MQKEQRMTKMKQNIQELWDNFKRQEKEVVQREERKNRLKEISAIIMAKKFPKLMTDTKYKTLEAQKTPSRINNKITTSRNIQTAEKPQIEYLGKAGKMISIEEQG